MAKHSAFGAVLEHVRRERGFPTAHAFYQRSEGRKMFRLSYRNYLNLEQGKSLPKPERLEAILRALDLNEHSPQGRELVEAYFAAVGFERLGRFLRGGASPGFGEEELRLSELAARRALAAKRVNLSLEQWRLMAGNYAAYVCDDLLENTAGGLNFAELAGQTGLSLKETRRTVRALAAAGLAVVSKDRVRSAFEEKLVRALPITPSTMKVQAGLFKNQQRLAEESAVVERFAVKVRLTAENVKHVQRRLDQLADVANLYYSNENTPDSDVYMIRGQIFRLFPKRRAG